MALFKKKQEQEATLSQEAAGQMLSNIFEACDYEPNRVPMEVLQSYSHYRRERHILQKGIIVLAVLMFLLLPLLFVTANVEVGWVQGTPPGSPIVQVAARSLIPVESVTASKPVQPWNTPFPMLCTLSGITISVKAVQPAKASLPMLVTFLESVTVSKPVQPWNTPFPMLCTLSGIAISVKTVQPAKASLPMLVTFLESVTASKPVQP